MKPRFELLIPLAFGLVASAEVIHVPEDYSAIQTAINFATTGDEIIVGPGIYNEEINFLGQGIYLHSSGGAEVTMITSDGTIVTCASGEGPDTILEGFAIVGGFKGMMNLNASSPTIHECLFSDNDYSGIDTDSGDIIVEDCVFTGNDNGFSGGGGIYQSGGSLSVYRCIFDGNTTSNKGGGIKAQSAEVQISDCLFSGNSAAPPGGRGGGIWVSQCSGSITRCVFTENSSTVGAGLYAQAQPSQGLRVTNCMFFSNAAEVYGGGIYGSPETVNCTFFGNTAGSNGGGVHNGGEIGNSIFWLNTPNQLTDAFRLVLTYSDIQGGWDGKGSNNINIYPQFMDIEFPYNLRLQPDSPCIDMGDNGALLKGEDADLDGNPRIVDGDGDGEAIVDMGAYEYQGCPQDMDGDGVVGPIDLATLLGAWGPCEGCSSDFDGDGIVGPIDLAALLGSWGPCL